MPKKKKNQKTNKKINAKSENKAVAEVESESSSGIPEPSALNEPHNKANVTNSKEVETTKDEANPVSSKTISKTVTIPKFDDCWGPIHVDSSGVQWRELDESLQTLSHEQLSTLAQSLITEKQIYALYIRSIEARQHGRYREAFFLMTPIMPFLATNHLAWTRLAEICIFELYDESWEYLDLYLRVFEGRKKCHLFSRQRVINESRPRHPGLRLRFGYISSYVAYIISKEAKCPLTCLTASQNHAYILLKLRKYRESLDVIRFFMKKVEEAEPNVDQIEHMLLFKAEAKYATGKFDRAIEYCLQVLKDSRGERLKMRAEMVLAMSYMKKDNYRLAYSYVINLVTSYRLDDMMVENVAHFGITIAHRMRNYPMLKLFLRLLQSGVH